MKAGSAWVIVAIVALLSVPAVADAQQPPPGYEQQAVPPPPPPPPPPQYQQQPVSAAPQQPVPPPPPGGVAQPGGVPPGTVVPAPAPATMRHGFTLELGLGVAYFTVPEADLSRAGLAGLNVMIGGFLDPTLAIGVRVSGGTMLGEDPDDQLTVGSLLAGVEYFVNDWLMVGGGAGLGALVGRLGGFAAPADDTGYALEARVGAAFVQWAHGLLRGALAFMPAWLQGGTVTSTSFAVEWQYY